MVFHHRIECSERVFKVICEETQPGLIIPAFFATEETQPCLTIPAFFASAYLFAAVLSVFVLQKKKKKSAFFLTIELEGTQRTMVPVLHWQHVAHARLYFALCNPPPPPPPHTHTHTHT